MHQTGTQTYDLVVLGAGPAGAAAAFAAARDGLSVALIDKAAFPRAKLCGGLFSGRARMYFEKVFDRPLDPALFDPRHTVGFYMRGLPMGAPQITSPMHVTMRWDMDAWLKDLACQAGAADFTGHRVAALDLATNTVTLQDGAPLSYKVLVGADGVNSLVSKHLNGRSYDPARIGFALEIEAPNTTDLGRDALLRVDFDAANWGYGWEFPKARTTTIGIGGIHLRNPDMQERMARYRTLLGDNSTARVKGHFLPFGEDKGPPGRGNVLLAGDAAGFIDPITGEGIAYAFQSGQCAARAAARAIAMGKPANALKYYKRGVAPIRRSLRIACRIRPLVFSDRFRPVFERNFEHSRVLKQAFLKLLNGECEYPRILVLVVRRLPGAILRRRWGRQR